MNYLKKKLKPITSSLSGTSSSSTSNKNNKEQQLDLESELYDDYVVEAPPHPSELLALGVDPTEIDVNDPDKLRELFEKAKGKKVNSVFLAKQRQKEEIEQRKRTKEEWKFFDSLSARVEEAVKNSNRTLEQLKESTVIDDLTEPDYEFLTDPIHKSTNLIIKKKKKKNEQEVTNLQEEENQQLAVASSKGSSQKKPAQQSESEQLVVRELFEDLGIDLRPAELRRESPIPELISTGSGSNQTQPDSTNSGQQKETTESSTKDSYKKPVQANSDDPFDTTYVDKLIEKPELIDPFDTSFVDDL